MSRCTETDVGPPGALWEVRKAGLNIMRSMKGDGKPVSFIEDCAVPLEHLADYTQRLTDVFGSRLYVEIQRHGLDSERATEADLIALADHAGLPLVATNEPYFAYLSDYEAHDALLCVAEGAVVSTSERRRLSPEHRFKTRAEMTELFADLGKRKR